MYRALIKYWQFHIGQEYSLRTLTLTLASTSWICVHFWVSKTNLSEMCVLNTFSFGLIVVRVLLEIFRFNLTVEIVVA